MKRTITLLIITLFLGINASAQPQKHQKMIHMAAVRVARQLEIGDSERETFIVLYQNYKKECGRIMKTQPAVGKDSESNAELKILSDFDKSEKMLALRKQYYYKFREILSPSLIQKMYDMEKSAVTSRAGNRE